MNLDRVNQYVQTGANIGVILSILFLAWQISRTELVMQAQTRGALAQQASSLLYGEASDADLASIVRRSYAGEELSPDDQFRHVRAAVDRETATAFDLAAAPPIRFVVYDLGAHGSAVLVSAHHIALDHWSLLLLRREIRAALDDPGYADRPPPTQYADYAGWSRSASNVARLAKDLDWWERYLQAPPELSAFEADRAPELRGTGASGAARASFGWHEAKDLAACRAFLEDQGFAEVGVHGCSLGAAAALYALRDVPPPAFLVLEAPYRDIESALHNRLPWLPCHVAILHAVGPRPTPSPLEEGEGAKGVRVYAIFSACTAATSRGMPGPMVVVRVALRM